MTEPKKEEPKITKEDIHSALMAGVEEIIREEREKIIKKAHSFLRKKFGKI